jgi:long-chain acyl-CoA synthetase
VQKVWLKHYPPGVPAEVDVTRPASLVALLDESFGGFADRIALRFMGRGFTYGQVDETSRALAAWLQGEGVQRGDRIAVMVPNMPQVPVAVAAILRAGGVVVNVDPQLAPRELEHQLKDSGARIVFVAEHAAHALGAVIEAVPPRRAVVTGLGDLLGFPRSLIVNAVARSMRKGLPSYALPGSIGFNEALAQGRRRGLRPVTIGGEDIAVLQYTGGTTGVSKGAVLRHRQVVANVLQARAWFQPAFARLEPREPVVTVWALPLHHLPGFTTNMMLGLRLGGCGLMVPNPGDLASLFKTLSAEAFHSFPATSTLFDAMVQHPDFGTVDWSRLVLALGVGMPVTRDTAGLWLEKTGCAIVEAYGMAETAPLVACHPVDGSAPRRGTIGLPLPGTELRLLDDDGREVAPGVPGEIAVRGPQVMAGYWQRPEETARVMTPDGFFRTGDMGVADEAGGLRVVDRKQDMIVVGGFNVVPNEVEDVVGRMPGVLECAAVGVPDVHQGERVKLVIVRSDPALVEDHVHQYCEQHLTGYKRPKAVEFRAELPKTPVGRVLRRELRG